MLRLKTKLVFDHISPYLPICLPPRCDEDHDCRTRDGNTKRDLIGKRTVTSIGNYNSLFGSRIITNGQCKYGFVTDLTQNFRIRRYITNRFHLPELYTWKIIFYMVIIGIIFALKTIPRAQIRIARDKVREHHCPLLRMTLGK